MNEVCYKDECRIPVTFHCDDCGKPICVAHVNIVRNPNKNENLFLCDKCKEQREQDEAQWESEQ